MDTPKSQSLAALPRPAGRVARSPVITLLMRRPYFARGKKWSGVSPESLGLKRRSPLAGVGTTTVKEA